MDQSGYFGHLFAWNTVITQKETQKHANNFFVLNLIYERSWTKDVSIAAVCT